MIGSHSKALLLIDMGKAKYMVAGEVGGTLNTEMYIFLVNI